ncbi:RHPN2 [Cordylochernes scorpioides]|uniref:RHPN2 n=1 Tax=Cordylochernes scorpioides TaxID=51811 RepID=A0ABY6KBA2_9ARAC|nr:RHPN2 [Cordylochernes scorpioides]
MLLRRDSWLEKQAIRTPSRDATGIQLLMEYYNLLFYIDRRFFSPHRSLGIFFEWYDSLTGLPSIQKTVAFEKACVLFNMAALYTQVGAKQERGKMEGIELAVDNFLRAAGMLQFIRANFSNAPSVDLSPEILDLLMQLMTAQAKECLYEKLLIQDQAGLEKALEAAQEAASVAEVYGQLKQAVSQAPESVKSHLPTSWLSLVLVKHEHYSGLAHCHVGTALVDFPGNHFEIFTIMILLSHLEHLVPIVAETFFLGSKSKAAYVREWLANVEFLAWRSKLSEAARASLEYLHPAEIGVPDTPEQRLILGRSHLREALQRYEEALRMHRMCRQLRQAESLRSRLRTDLDMALQRYAQAKRDDCFQDSSPDVPPILPTSQFRLTLTAPDFSGAPGPLAIFSARSYWSAPRTVHLEKRPSEVFGFSVRGDSPVIIAGVDSGSLAQVWLQSTSSPCAMSDFVFGVQTAGMRAGDFIVGVGQQDTKWGRHEDVVGMIRSAGDSLVLRLVTPMDRNYLTSKMSSSAGSSSGVSSASSATLVKRLSWSFFRRTKPASPVSVSNDIMLR